METYREIKRDLFRLLGGIVLFVVIADLAKCGFDATDNYGGGKRSGVQLRTDYGTGCQYLEANNGGLTPRLDANGNHICEAKPSQEVGRG